MKTMMLILILAWNAVAFSQTPDKFVPALGSDQKRITAETLKQEHEQFQALGAWKSAMALRQVSEDKRNQLKVDYERMKVLKDKGQGSQSQLEQAELNLRGEEENFQRISADVERAKAATTVHKLRVLEEGNPGDDHRLEIIEAMLQALTLERQGQQLILASTKSTADHFERRYKAGQYLLGKGVISQSELERRRMDFDSARAAVLSMEHQIEATLNSMRGLELSRTKL